MTRTRLLGALVAVILAATVVVACMPVTPSVTFTHSTFEGFPVISYVPPDPKGMIYVFHGTGGSADVAEKVETVDALNLFVAAGYGFVSTSSTERTGTKRWDVRDPSLVTNPDLARLVRLQDHLVATTSLEATTPLVGIGHSNGARFVTLWGQTWADAGYPVAALWASAGRIADPVVDGGGLDVPTFFVVAENDTTVPPAGVVAGYQATVSAGVRAELRTSEERALDPLQYLRVPGVDSAEATAIVDALVATGVWDETGTRVVPDVDQAISQAQTVVLPASVTAEGLGPEISNETAVLMAVHQFSAEWKLDALAFVDAEVTG